jgi:hypothetical protein
VSRTLTPSPKDTGRRTLKCPAIVAVSRSDELSDRPVGCLSRGKGPQDRTCDVLRVVTEVTRPNISNCRFGRIVTMTLHLLSLADVKLPPVTPDDIRTVALSLPWTEEVKASEASAIEA